MRKRRVSPTPSNPSWLTKERVSRGDTVGQEDPGWSVPQPSLVDSVSGLVLRPIALGDTQRVFDACQDPLLQRYTAVPVPSLWEHAEQLTDPANQPAFDRRESADFAITTTGDLFDGVVGVKSADWVNRVAEVGFWLGPWARGRGVASNALALVREWAFASGLYRLEAFVHVGNRASVGALTRAGFQEEGVLRGRFLIRGERPDMVLLAAINE